MQITFATGNPGKIREARAMLEPLGFEIEQWDHGYPEIQADTLEAVAGFGLTVLEDELEAPFMLEDAGLFVDSLDGFPGVYSSYAYGTLGWEGLLKLLDGVEERSARFQAVTGFHDGDRQHLFSGVVEGQISLDARGEGGFGFDPVFIPDGHKRTFAEMTVEEKGGLSHRTRALDALVAHLEGQA